MYKLQIMSTLEDDLGIDPDSPEDRRAFFNVSADADLLTDLVQLRKSAQLSQKQIADRLGISQAAVSTFERYENDPKLSTIRRYSQAVGALVTHVVESDQGQLFEPDGFVAARVVTGLRVLMKDVPASPILIPAPVAARRRDEFALSA